MGRSAIGRPTRWVIGGVLAAAAVAGGTGLAVATVAGEGGSLTGSDVDRAGAAAVEAAGGGRVLGVELEDGGPGRYEVEVRLDDGAEVDVLLDEAFAVVATDPGDADDDDRDGDGIEDDDAPVSPEDRQRAGDAAVAAAGGGRAVEVEADDDGAAFSVEVRFPDGREVDVDLGPDFQPLGR